jgi:tripeptide aminopeptidase
VSAHPGFAKGQMVSALKIASAIVDALPKHELSPETTEKMQGFIHPVSISGGIEKTTIEFIIRDFAESGLVALENTLNEIAKNVVSNYPKARYDFLVRQQYRNMKQVLDKNPAIVDNALEAIKRAGLTPVLSSIRGGTDGSRLSYMGLPCPNIFAGEHAFHSKLEWVSVQDMEKAVETIVHLCAIWEEKS